MSDLTVTQRAPEERTAQRLLQGVWERPWLGVAVAAGVAALAGLAVALTMPRGPATAGQALVVLGSGLGVGLVAGIVTRSRWAMLLAPAAYMVAVELGRLGAVGPTVDAIRFDNMFTILALVLGRGFHGLVGLLPMVLGVEVGVQLTRPSRDPARERRAGRWVPAALLGLLVAALAVLIALPARTPPIVDGAGNPVPGSIAELTTVNINGHDHGLMIRGYDTNKPILLYLSGGPGQSSLPWPRVLFDDLSRDMIIVGWDQRGTGKSYAALDPTGTLTLQSTVDDTIAVTNYLRERFDEDKIYLLGESWGTTLATLAAQQRPDLYHAVIGSGQMVSQRETDRRIYRDVLDYAERTGNEAMREQMLAFGEPPYDDMIAYAIVLGYYDLLYKPYTPPAAYIEKGQAADLGPWNVLGSEYNFVEKVNVFRGFLDMASVLYPQLQVIDFRQDVTRLDVPLYVLDGAAELSARRDLALEWFEQVDAPIKRLYTFENSAHAPAFEHFEDFTRIMREDVVPETGG
jgi:pimeloyl-ACP methyl ester carboxylesterase